MEAVPLFVILSTIVLSTGFAYDDQENTDLTRDGFARDFAKQRFAFAFANRYPEIPEERSRFARDLDNSKKFSFAKKSPDFSEESRGFARELEGNKKFAFAFAKRFAGSHNEVRRQDNGRSNFAAPNFTNVHSIATIGSFDSPGRVSLEKLWETLGCSVASPLTTSPTSDQ
ncbi:hypothetical protein V3C99_006556 [Haemonchus contortus]